MTLRRRLSSAVLVIMLVLSGCAPRATPSPTVAGPGVTAAPGETPSFEEGPQTPSSLGKAVLFHTQFALDIDADGVPVGEGDAFPVGTQQILVLVGWETAPAGTELRVRIYQDDRFVVEHTHVVRREHKSGVVVPLVAPGGFPAGAFSAEVAWNGVPDEFATFSVGEVPRPGVLIGTGDGHGPMAYAQRDAVLVVTRFAALRAHLGSATDTVLQAAGRIGDLHDLEADGVARPTPEAAAGEVQRLLRSAAYRYLLIVGNDDVMPYFHVANPLADSERKELDPWELPADWLPSDDPYTDLDADRHGVPDLPAARIPSSDDPDLLLTQLHDLTPPDGHAYALVNQQRRSQATAVVSAMSQAIGVQLDYSPPTDASEFAAGPGSDARYLYILLHGIGTLTNSWVADLKHWAAVSQSQPYLDEWAVDPANGPQLEAVSVPNNPGSHGLVNVGACYGAWTLDTRQEPQHKTADNNLALHYLKSGARAFVADTHLSYSIPNDATGIPLGRTGFERVFWRSISEGKNPIDAFQAAKVEVAAAIDELVGAGQPELAAINEKTVHYMVFLGRP